MLQDNLSRIPCGCRRQNSGTLEWWKKNPTWPPLCGGAQRSAAPLLTCSFVPTNTIGWQWDDVPVSSAWKSSVQVILNHKQSFSVHFGRTAKFIISVSSFLIPHTRQHLGFCAGLLWVHVCLCLCAKKEPAFFQYKYFTLSHHLLAMPASFLSISLSSYKVYTVTLLKWQVFVP